MKGQKCANCGYFMGFGESIISNVLHVIGGKIASPAQGMLGPNTISNATKLKCPKCGEVGRWIREDE